MSKYIYYTGIGANPSGKHSVQEFLKIMNKNYGVQCSQYLTEQEYEPCIKKKYMDKSFFEKFKKNSSYKRNKKTEKEYKKLFKKCQKQKTTYKNRSCKLEEFINFSGAENR